MIAILVGISREDILVVLAAENQDCRLPILPPSLGKPSN